MTSQIIESAVMILFGITITISSIANKAGINFITMGALLTLSGICWLVTDIIENKNKK